MKATVSELHRDTAKLLRPVIHDGEVLIITEEGQPCAKIIPFTASESPVDVIAKSWEQLGPAPTVDYDNL
jgi:prevent-host-death family protein